MADTILGGLSSLGTLSFHTIEIVDELIGDQQCDILILRETENVEERLDTLTKAIRDHAVQNCLRLSKYNCDGFMSQFLAPFKKIRTFEKASAYLIAREVPSLLSQVESIHRFLLGYSSSRQIIDAHVEVHEFYDFLRLRELLDIFHVPDDLYQVSDGISVGHEMKILLHCIYKNYSLCQLIELLAGIGKVSMGQALMQYFKVAFVKVVLILLSFGAVIDSSNSISFWLKVTVDVCSGDDDVATRSIALPKSVVLVQRLFADEFVGKIHDYWKRQRSECRHRKGDDAELLRTLSRLLTTDDDLPYSNLDVICESSPQERQIGDALASHNSIDDIQNENKERRSAIEIFIDSALETFRARHEKRNIEVVSRAVNSECLNHC